MTKRKNAAKATEANPEEFIGPMLPTKDAVLAELEAEQPPAGMSAQMQKHRAGYVETVSYSNRPSLDNGDEVAQLLRKATPDAVVQAAEALLGFEKGELAARYAKLNPGQRRMNSGNRIRAAIKKGTINGAQLADALH